MAPISGNYNFRDPSMYMNHAKGFTTSYIKGGSQGIGNYLNGQMESTLNNTISSTADNLMGDNVNPYAKMAVKSALNILMSWVKGQDKDEADKAKTEGNELSNQMQDVAHAGDEATTQLGDEAKDGIETESEEITNTQEEIQERNEENEQIEEENEQKQEEIDEAKERQEEILDELQQTPVRKSGADNKGTEDNPTELSTEGVEKNSEQAQLIEEYNELGETIVDNQTILESNQENIESNIAANDEAYANNIEQAGENIQSLYTQYSGAMKNIQDIISGKQKMFTPEMIMKAAEQMAMSAINGTEGGVLAAAATAMGASSIFSFGATASEAAKYAEASGDKFSSIAPRMLASAGIKIAQSTAQAYVQQALSNISQIAGVNLNEIYNTGMDIYRNAAAENPNKDALADNNDGGDDKKTDPQKPKTDQA